MVNSPTLTGVTITAKIAPKYEAKASLKGYSTPWVLSREFQRRALKKIAGSSKKLFSKKIRMFISRALYRI